jgi:hypothetical protein
MVYFSPGNFRDYTPVRVLRSEHIPGEPDGSRPGGSGIVGCTCSLPVKNDSLWFNGVQEVGA